MTGAVGIGGCDWAMEAAAAIDVRKRSWRWWRTNRDLKGIFTVCLGILAGMVNNYVQYLFMYKRKLVILGKFLVYLEERKRGNVGGKRERMNLFAKLGFLLEGKKSVHLTAQMQLLYHGWSNLHCGMVKKVCVIYCILDDNKLCIYK